jgi:hypothetical protein
VIVRDGTAILYRDPIFILMFAQTGKLISRFNQSKDPMSSADWKKVANKYRLSSLLKARCAETYLKQTGP